MIVDAKAHGLGYLYPPRELDEKNPQDDWIFEAWRWILEGEIAQPRGTPDWFPFPAMMRMTVTTPAVLGMLKGFTRPFNFIFVPIVIRIAERLCRKKAKLSLIMPFSKHSDQWLNTKAIDVNTGKEYSLTLLDPSGRTRKVEVKCYGNILSEYREHPEAKFLGYNGEPCDSLMRGLLRRSHIIANRHRYIGKETSRRWEQGDDVSLIDFRCVEYSDGKAVADPELRKRIARIGIRKVARDTGIHTDTVMLITRGKAVKPSTLTKVVRLLGRAKQSAQKPL